MTYSVKDGEMWKEMMASPEVRGAFMLANEAGMTEEQGLEMALLSLFAQNQRLREGLVSMAREVNLALSVGRGFDENYQPVNGDS